MLFQNESWFNDAGDESKVPILARNVRVRSGRRGFRTGFIVGQEERRDIEDVIL